jgi:hypothetical protein
VRLALVLAGIFAIVMQKIMIRINKIKQMLGLAAGSLLACKLLLSLHLSQGFRP